MGTKVRLFHPLLWLCGMLPPEATALSPSFTTITAAAIPTAAATTTTLTIAATTTAGTTTTLTTAATAAAPAWATERRC